MAIDVSRIPAIPAWPKFYQLHVMLLGKASSFYNELEDVTYEGTPGELVLKGTMEEPWIIPAKKLSKYELRDGTPLSMGVLEGMEKDSWIPIQTRPVSPDTPPTMVVQVPVDVTGEVTTERGDVLKVNRPGIPHGEGDVICGADTEWPWVVNGAVFERTYTLEQPE